MNWTQNFKRLYGLYQQNRDLISVGAYQPGADSNIDRAIRMHPQMVDFIAQDMNQSVGFDASRTQLAAVLDSTADEDQPQVVDALVDQQLNATQAG
jgi:flagellum-specific ATP synthase